jgi:hypothetical protein
MTNVERQVLTIYQHAFNLIEDITEYREPRPDWLKTILYDMHRELMRVQREHKGDENEKPQV